MDSKDVPVDEKVICGESSQALKDRCVSLNKKKVKK